MGSPCNRIGNDPDATPATGSSACSGLGTGRFWAGVSGERTDKQNGDPYQSTLCTGATSDNCPAGTNTDYTAEGYLYNITVKTAGATQIEIFDPDFVATGNQCDSTNLDGATAARNPFVKDATDANNRYGKGNSANSGWCTGDTNNLIGGATKEVMQTSYSVLGTQGAPTSPTTPPSTSARGPGRASTGHCPPPSTRRARATTWASPRASAAGSRSAPSGERGPTSSRSTEPAATHRTTSRSARWVATWRPPRSRAGSGSVSSPATTAPGRRSTSPGCPAPPPVRPWSCASSTWATPRTPGR